MLEWVVLVVSLLLSGFFSSSESALLSISKARAIALENKNKYIKKLKDNEELAVISILLGNNLVNVLASSIATEISLNYFNHYGIALTTFVMTFLLLTFGEVIPKSLALYAKEKLLFSTAKVLYLWVKITSPISFAYIKLMDFIKNSLRLKGSKQVTEDEIEEILVLGEKHGEITSYEKRVAVNALDLAETTASEISIKPKKVFMVSASKTISWLRNKIEKDNILFSRIPVFYGSKNNVIGYVKVGDLIGEKGNKRILSLLRPILVVSHDSSIEQILRYMRKSGIPIAVVRKKNKFAGIVTVTDIIDEIVGEFKEEIDIEKLKMLEKK